MVYYNVTSYNKSMFLVGILTWWYGNGWLARVRMMGERLAQTVDYFSIELLLSTLFSPFRQISAGSTSGPIGDQFRAFIDKSISRVIGAFVRLFMIILGTLVIIMQSIFALVVLAFWLIIPLLPVAGVIMTVIGWVPSWT